MSVEHLNQDLSEIVERRLTIVLPYLFLYVRECEKCEGGEESVPK